MTSTGNHMQGRKVRITENHWCMQSCIGLHKTDS